MELSDIQVREIRDELILTSDSELVTIDLLDHVCCEVEENLELGLGYEESRRKVLDKFDPEHIVQLEKATRYLTQTNYYMSKSSIISGVIGMTLAVLAMFGKTWDIAGSNETLLVAALVVIFGMILPGIRRVNKSARTPYRISNWIGFAGATSVVMGLPFVLLKYYFLSIGLLAAGGILLIIYMFRMSSQIREFVTE